jgi:hypothetical protein
MKGIACIRIDQFISTEMPKFPREIFLNVGASVNYYFKLPHSEISPWGILAFP